MPPKPSLVEPEKRERYNNGAMRRLVQPRLDVLKNEHKRRGPPVRFDERIFDSILEQVAKGAMVSKLCNGKPPYPDYSSWYRWLAGSAELRQRYAIARHMLTERYADEIVMIADGRLPMGEDAAEPPSSQRDRLRIDARRWVMGKLNPAFWGDRAPPAAVTEDPAETPMVIDVRSMDPASRKALKEVLLALEEKERNADK
jgi:hypothetical protein